jgi:4-aminobutyrate aminotransferase-like enzyme
MPASSIFCEKSPQIVLHPALCVTQNEAVTTTVAQSPSARRGTRRNMKPILALNAFEAKDTAALPGEVRPLVEQRNAVMGAASVLFYDTPIEMVSAHGAVMVDAQGREYLDFYNNVPSVGHCHQHVTAAIARQLTELNIHSRYLHRGMHAYAERLLATFPAGLSNLTLTCTGSESNDLALRLARNFTGRTGVIVSAGAYHGNTAAVTEVSPTSAKSGTQSPQVRLVPTPDSYRVPPEELATRFAADVSAAALDLEQQGFGVAALLVDSIFSSDGVYADPPGFLAAAVAVTKHHGGLFIADEVQPGFGRTGTHLWGFARHGVVPDIVTMGKPMGNGYPMGGVVTRPEILTALCDEVGYFNTFGGTPVAAAAGMAVLDVLENEQLMANAEHVGAYLRQSLRELAVRFPCLGDVRGAGLYNAVEIVSDPQRKTPAADLTSKLMNGLRQRQILVGAAGPAANVLKLRPPLCLSRANVDSFIHATADTLAALGH